MRHAASYGIVDRKILYDHYLHRMSLEGMALYLFLVLAADREGRSYYGDRSIGEILRLASPALVSARYELLAAGLIDYRAPNWWVRSLMTTSPPSSQCGYQASGQISASRTVISPSQGPRLVRGVVPEALKHLLQTLEEKS